ncbi:response regulator transcription factor [Reyranella soli]|uniref:Two-component response regulator n=1 Tax=Reyranella soli TaxID=1230389 RepID=A0A512NNB8_9HYPH|nr:response regulator [Reyranella soli]GEP60447.1 two-component response regulator [Reyranella soli]
MDSTQAQIVAVVDDDEDVRRALGNLLASLDLAVADFPSAEDFLASPACRAAACLITDVQMPGMSGLELQRHLIDSGNRLPVIFVTAFPREHVRQQAEAGGAIGFFAKPFDGALLIECVERALAARAVE